MTLLGTTNDVEAVLKRNRYFLFPSLYEGLGIVVIEAQAAGMTCFISDAVPPSADCGGCVVLPLSDTAAQWASRIAAFIQSGDKKTATDTLLNTYNIHYTVKKLERLYSQLCSPARSGER